MAVPPTAGYMHSAESSNRLQRPNLSTMQHIDICEISGIVIFICGTKLTNYVSSITDTRTFENSFVCFS